jgi:hypothetical protein
MRCRLVLLWLLAGCDATTCARHSDCTVGEVCMVSGTCAVAPDDGGPSVDDATDVDAADASVTEVVIDAPADAALDAPGDAP